MSRPLTPERLAKREALKNRTTEEVYQDAVKRGLESNVSAERVAAIKAYADERNPGIMEMKEKLKQAEDLRTAAETALKAVQTALDAANTELVPLREQVAKVGPLEAELADLRANFDLKVADARKELVEEAQQCQWKSERAENAARDTLATAQSQFGARGQQILLDEVKRIVEEHHIPEPEDLTKLPAGISPLYLTLWSHSPIKAQLMIGYAKSFPEPSENFTRTLLRYLKATLPLQMFAGMEPPAPIENLAEKIAVMTEQAKRWNVWTDIQQQFEAEQVRRQSEFLRYHNAQMIALQNEGALRGAGRSEIGVEEKSLTGYQGPHPPECVCGRAGCNPLPAHLRPFEVEEKF